MADKKPPKNAILTPLAELRFKAGKLQQRFHVEEAKTVYYLWVKVPEVKESEPD
jgi:hypothetical protein